MLDIISPSYALQSKLVMLKREEETVIKERERLLQAREGHYRCLGHSGRCTHASSIADRWSLQPSVAASSALATNFCRNVR